MPSERIGSLWTEYPEDSYSGKFELILSLKEDSITFFDTIIVNGDSSLYHYSAALPELGKILELQFDENINTVYI